MPSIFVIFLLYIIKCLYAKLGQHEHLVKNTTKNMFLLFLEFELHHVRYSILLNDLLLLYNI